MFSFWYDFFIYQLHDEILLDESGREPNNNMQTFRLPTSQFIIYKNSYKGIYKNEVQCKVRMQI
jgi:hypothetical protein